MVWNSERHSGSSPAAEGKSRCLLTVIPRGHPANLGEAGAPITAYHISTRHLHLPCEDCQGSHDIRPSLSSTFPYPRSPVSWNEWMSVKRGKSHVLITKHANLPVTRGYADTLTQSSFPSRLTVAVLLPQGTAAIRTYISFFAHIRSA